MSSLDFSPTAFTLDPINFIQPQLNICVQNCVFFHRLSGLHNFTKQFASAGACQLLQMAIEAAFPSTRAESPGELPPLQA